MHININIKINYKYLQIKVMIKFKYNIMKIERDNLNMEYRLVSELTKGL